VRNLKRGSFRVFENDVRQTVGHFLSENIPLELVAPVDVSGSMTAAMPQVKRAVKKFFTALRPQDHVTVLGFNDGIFTLARPTVDLATRLRAIDRLAPWGGTSLYEVIIHALEIQGRQTGRRAVVMFTDGEDRNSHIPIAAAERRVESSDSLLYLIGLGQAARVPALRQVLERFARVSGGRVFFADTADQLDDPFAQIVEELSNQYLIGYEPKDDRKDGTWRAIRVEVDNPEYHVRARQGYRAVARAGAGR
jgi:Ca-activated chloride channel family protein